ncbi:MAG TPA: hypothetical protein VK914_04105 [bacterium]|jgi:hypothetical protein|nr:hypothetical protein [bacterium]
MLDRLLRRFKLSLPWQVVMAPGATEEAKKAIRDAFRPEEEVARDNFMHKLADFLLRLETAPLSVLGHPPLSTKDPNIFRYTGDPQAVISVIADLDERNRVLRVARIKIKVGGKHGHHG